MQVILKNDVDHLGYKNDIVDVKRSYRFEQGFTYELNLSGVSDEARDAFVDKKDANYSK